LTGDELVNRVDTLERELAELRDQLGDESLFVPASALNAGDSDWITASFPNFETNGTWPTVQVSGFLQADWGWFNQDATNIATVGDVQDGADFRRARLNAHGDAWENVGYMMEFDFGFAGRPSFMDVYLDVRDTPVGTFRFGQWRHPIGMDALTSVKELTFLERALPFAFLPFRQIGMGVFDHSGDETLTWAISGFRFPTDTYGGNIGDNGGYGLATRVTFAPWLTEDGSRLLHLGGAYSFGDPANDRVRYRNQPEFFVSETGGADLVPGGVPTNVPPFVDTGPINANNFNIFSAEGGLVLGSLYMQSEAIYAVVNQIGGPTVSFAGAYAYAGYFLTGEIRPYNRTSGVFGRVKPLNNFGAHGLGTWEVAARWSYIDLNDGNITGRRMNDFTAGANWYLNPRTKFQFNYIHAFLDDPTLGDSNADIFAFRGQVDF
jgi:phosphate-selective porin OprO and OprP